MIMVTGGSARLDWKGPAAASTKGVEQTIGLRGFRSMPPGEFVLRVVDNVKYCNLGHSFIFLRPLGEGEHGPHGSRL